MIDIMDQICQSLTLYLLLGRDKNNILKKDKLCKQSKT